MQSSLEYNGYYQVFTKATFNKLELYSALEQQDEHVIWEFAYMHIKTEDARQTKSLSFSL